MKNALVLTVQALLVSLAFGSVFDLSSSPTAQAAALTTPDTPDMPSGCECPDCCEPDV